MEQNDIPNIKSDKENKEVTIDDLVDGDENNAHTSMYLETIRAAVAIYNAATENNYTVGAFGKYTKGLETDYTGPYIALDENQGVSVKLKTKMTITTYGIFEGGATHGGSIRINCNPWSIVYTVPSLNNHIQFTWSIDHWASLVHPEFSFHTGILYFAGKAVKYVTPRSVAIHTDVYGIIYEFISRKLSVRLINDVHDDNWKHILFPKDFKNVTYFIKYIFDGKYDPIHGTSTLDEFWGPAGLQVTMDGLPYTFDYGKYHAPTVQQRMARKFKRDILPVYEYIVETPFYVLGALFMAPVLFISGFTIASYITMTFIIYRSAGVTLRDKTGYLVELFTGAFAFVTSYAFGLLTRLGYTRVGKFAKDTRAVWMTILIVTLFVTMWHFVWKKNKEEHGDKEDEETLKIQKKFKKTVKGGFEKFARGSLYAGAVTLLFSTSADLFLEVATDAGWFHPKNVTKKLIEKINRYVKLLGAFFTAFGALGMATLHGKKKIIKQSELDNELPSSDSDVELVDVNDFGSKSKKDDELDPELEEWLKPERDFKTRFGEFWTKYVVANKWAIMLVCLGCVSFVLLIYGIRRKIQDYEDDHDFESDELFAITGTNKTDMAHDFVVIKIKEWVRAYNELKPEDAIPDGKPPIANILEQKVLDACQFLNIPPEEGLKWLKTGEVDIPNGKKPTSDNNNNKKPGKGNQPAVSERAKASAMYAQKILNLPRANKGITFDQVMNYPVVHFAVEKPDHKYMAVAFGPKELSTEYVKDFKFDNQSGKWGDLEMNEASDKFQVISNAIKSGRNVIARVYNPQQGRFMSKVIKVTQFPTTFVETPVEVPLVTGVYKGPGNVKYVRTKANTKTFNKPKVIPVQPSIAELEEWEEQEAARLREQQKQALADKLKKSKKPPQNEQHSKEEIIEEHGAFNVDKISKSCGRIFNGATEGTWFAANGMIFTARHLLYPGKKLVDTVWLTDSSGAQVSVSTDKFMEEQPDIDIMFCRVKDVKFKHCPPSLTVGPRHTVCVVMIYSNNNKTIQLYSGVASCTLQRRMSDMIHCVDEATYGDSGAPIFDTTGKVFALHTGSGTKGRTGMTLPDISFVDDDTIIQKKETQYAITKNLIEELHALKVAPLNLVGDYPDDIQITEFDPIVEHDRYQRYCEPLKHNFQPIGSLDWAVTYGKGKLVVDETIRQKCLELGLPDAATEYAITVPTYESNYIDAQKYIKDYPFNPERKAMLIAYDMMVEQYKPILYDFKMLTFEEVKKRIDMQKACGGRWKKKFQTKGQVYEAHEEFLRKIILRFFKDHYFPTALLHGSDKEEIRLRQKVLEQKVRVFNAVDLEHTILHLMCYGDFMDRITNADITDTNIFVGESPWYGGFNKLAKYLLEVATTTKCFSESDQSKYDSHIRNHHRLNFMEFFVKHMCSDSTVYNHLLAAEKALLQPLFVFGDGNVIRLIHSSHFSGEPMTLHRNSLMMVHLFYYCLVRTGFSRDQIKKYVRFMTLGDDNIWSLAVDSGIPAFTSHVFEKLCSEMGFECDPGVKHFQSLMQSSFCGLRPIALADDYIVFHPDIRKQLFSLVVHKRKATPFEIMTKMLNLYQYMLFTEHRERVYQLCLWWKSLFPTSADINNLWVELDVIHLHRFYYPHYHSVSDLITYEPIKFLNNEMEFKYYGNNCGPGWSGGRYGKFDEKLSGNSVDSVDAACFEHDRAYADGSSANLSTADYKLALEALKGGRPDIALPIGAQGVLRQFGLLPKVLSQENKMVTKQKSMRRLKNAQRKNGNGQSKPKRAKRAKGTRPVKKAIKAIENKLKNEIIPIAPKPYKASSTRQMRTSRDGSRLWISDIVWMGKLSNYNNVDPGIIQLSRELSPEGLGAFTVAQFGRMYQKFKIRAHLEFCSTCPSTTGGSVFFAYDPDSSDDFGIGERINPNDYISGVMKERFAIVSDFQVTTKKRLLTSEWRTCWTSTPKKNFEKNLRTGGTFYCGANDASVLSGAVGNVYITYEIEFYERVSEYELDYAYLTGPVMSNLARFGPLTNDQYTGVGVITTKTGNVINLGFATAIPGDYNVVAMVWHGTTNVTSASWGAVPTSHTNILFGTNIVNAIDRAISASATVNLWQGMIRMQQSDVVQQFVLGLDLGANPETEVDFYVYRNQTLPKNENYPAPSLVNTFADAFKKQRDVFLENFERYLISIKRLDLVKLFSKIEPEKLPLDTTLAISYLERFIIDIEECHQQESVNCNPKLGFAKGNTPKQGMTPKSFD